MKLFVCETNGELLGIPAQSAQRVVEDVAITPVCLMPPCYLGLLYHRGELFDVVDLGRLLDMAQPSITEGTRLLTIRWARNKIAIAAGRLHGIMSLSQAEQDDVFLTESGQRVRSITPEDIWGAVFERIHAAPGMQAVAGT